ncbi:MAG: glucoamylase family protein, partial [Bacillota bacterium]
MLYIFLITVNILILIIIAWRASIKRPEMKHMVRLDDDDLVRALLPFAREMRITEYGKGFNLASLYPVIQRAYKLIEKKVKRNEALFEYEKWLYQNIYLVKRFIFSKKKNSFKNLPHSKGEVRIVALARFIVNRSLNCLDSNRISLAMNTIKSELSLSFGEILHFNDAISYAAIEQIYILSQRILFHNKSKRLAQKGYIIKRKMISDVYNYFLLNNPKLSDETDNRLRRMGINPQSIAFNYNLSLTHSTKMAESLFNVLLNYNNYLPKDACLEYHNATSILKNQKDYEKMSLNTKQSFFRVIEKLSEKLNVSEMLIAKILVEMTEKNNTDIATILYDHYYSLKQAVKKGKIFVVPKIKSNKPELLYVLCILLTTIALCLGGWLWTGSLAGAIISVLPVFFIVEYMFNTILSSMLEQKTLPQMNYQSVPPEHNTMVVISEFITSVEQADEAVKHLLEVKEGNDYDNIQFVLLADFKNGDSEVLSEDNAIIARLSELLKDKDKCNVFVRRRVKDGDKFIGFERKRGAIMALTRYLMTGKDQDFAFILNKEHAKPVYIMTLDADNTVSTSGIKDMINIITHPYNEKYDLINAHSRYNLFSINTRFAKRFLHSSGIMGYPIYSSFYYNLFGKDVFCGKGIFKLKLFYNKLEGVFPSKKILSHDILEGALLKTGCGGTIFEDAPTSFLSERERRKRWMRGDIQLLPFIRRSWKNDEGKRYNSHMPIFYKFLIFRNAMAPLKDFLLLILGLMSVFISAEIWKYFFLVLSFPFIINQISILQGVNNDIRLRYIAEKTATNVKNLIEELFMLTYYGIANFFLFVNTLIKMIRKGNLLQWKTYYQAQKQRNMNSYVREFTVSIVFITVLGAIMFFIGLNPVFILAFGVWAYFAQLSLYWGNREFHEYSLTKQQKEKLLNYAQKTYKYFTLMHTPSGIIGDNIQIKPYKGQSKNTSPTNIGFTLLADIAAYYLGFIDSQKSVELLYNRIKSVDIMPKWHGNLYNWYKIDTYRPINNFISSVDSGNFIVCLMITKEFFKTRNFQKGYELAKKIIENTNLDKLFDHRKGLFYIGYNEKSNEYSGHYDILASEARLLSLVYISQSGKAEHWRNLQRDYTPLMGNTLLSWSGTMFEYLMSDLFIQSPRFSLLYESSHRAAVIQSRNTVKGIWGVSESGYYDFDDELRYQYYAFGLNKLSLRSEFDKSTFSPYSSVIALKYIPNEVMDNLNKIDEIGGFSDYGFYEALDLSGRTRFIASYMTHHQGMILASITNALNDNIFCKLLENCKGMKACMNLLNERTSEQTFAIKQKTNNDKVLRMENEYYEYISEIDFNTKSAALSNGALTVCFDTLGNNFLKYNDLFINAYRRIYDTHNGGYFYVCDYSNNLYSPSYYPLCDDITKRSVSYSDVEMTFENTELKLKQDICVADGLNAEVRRLTLKSEMQVKKVAYYMDISLNTYDGFNAHPVFNNLFIKSSYDEDNNAVIFHKRSMQKDGDTFVAFVIRGLKNLKIETNRFNLLGRNNSEMSPQFINDDSKEKPYPSLGDVLEPALGFTGEFEGEKKECQLITLVAESYEELQGYIKILPEDFYSYCKESSRMKYRIGNLANKLCGTLLYQPYSNKTLMYVWKNRLQNQFNFINNNKKTILYLYDESKNDFFIELLNAYRQWKYLGLDLRLIVYYSENFKATQKDHIIELLRKYFVQDYMLVEKSQKVEHLFDFVFIILDTELSIYELKSRENILRSIKTTEDGLREYDIETREQSSLKSGSGAYFEDSYILYEKPLLPYSNVICEKYGGIVITENGGGFYYFENSREFKATRHDFDPVKDTPFEYLYVRDANLCHRINGGSGKGRKTVYEKGIMHHNTQLTDFDTQVSHYIINEGMAKVMEIDIVPVSKNAISVDLIYAFYPSLNWTTKNDFIAVELNQSILSAHNLLNGKSLYIKVFADKGGSISDINFNNHEVPYFEITSLADL